VNPEKGSTLGNEQKKGGRKRRLKRGFWGADLEVRKGCVKGKNSEEKMILCRLSTRGTCSQRRGRTSREKRKKKDSPTNLKKAGLRRGEKRH